MALCLAGSATPTPAAVAGNQIRPAPFSARNSQLAKAIRRAANPSKRCYAANPSANGSADALISNDNLALSDQLHEDDFQRTAAHFPGGHSPHNSFHPDFVFGAASSAFQVEGATDIGGRGPSIWDTFCEKFPGKIADGRNGEPGAGSYQHYQEDVDQLSYIGLNAYRFSISWSRVLPNGKKDQPNEDGIRYYNRLIDALKDKGIEPYVTLFHWDVPQALEDEYGGFLSRKIIEDYKGFAELCFKRFGNRVKHWITMNEPMMFANMGYCYGLHAPGHCTPDLADFVCPVGDSLRQPYKVAHNTLLAHSEAVKLYKDKYKAKQGGKIGITLISNWFEPYRNNHPLDIEAQKRALDFSFGWFMDPLKFGKYPFSMRALVGDRLENFTTEESEKLIDSFDFLGVNYYTSRYVRDKPYDHTHKPVLSADDMFADANIVARDSVPIGPAQENSWVNVYPRGLHKLLVYIKNRYGNPPVYITENGVLKRDMDEQRKLDKPQGSDKEMLEDFFRMEYHIGHLRAIEDALSSRADVRGYFVWSLLDSFEWSDGYTSRFGLVHVDRRDKLRRYPKRSAEWLRQFISSFNNRVKAANGIPRDTTITEEKKAAAEAANAAAAPTVGAVPFANV